MIIWQVIYCVYLTEADRVPSVVVDPADFAEVLTRLNKIDEGEFVHSEVAQKRIGK